MGKIYRYIKDSEADEDINGNKNSGKIEADFYVSSEAEITNQGFPILNKYIDEIKKLN